MKTVFWYLLFASVLVFMSVMNSLPFLLQVRTHEKASLYALCRSWLRNGFPEETQVCFLKALTDFCHIRFVVFQIFQFTTATIFAQS